MRNYPFEPILSLSFPRERNILKRMTVQSVYPIENGLYKRQTVAIPSVAVAPNNISKNRKAALCAERISIPLQKYITKKRKNNIKMNKNINKQF